MRLGGEDGMCHGGCNAFVNFNKFYEDCKIPKKEKGPSWGPNIKA
jgi:hypothetical protein